jgi:hypothetical protein
VKFSEIANRLTGISTPLLGVSWQPTDLEVSAARRVIAFLEDRRVLYAPEEMEMAEHCVRSVLEIRHFLSDEIGKHDTGSGFAASLRGGWPSFAPPLPPRNRLPQPSWCSKAGHDAADGVRF